jgi:ATP-dependent Clp protease protease subunit
MYLNSIDPESDIKLFINSPGGSVVDGLAIYDVMNWVDADVATYAMGMAASMGSILLSSGEKGKRYSLPHSRVMIHQVSSGMQGQCADLEIAVREAKKHQEELYNILSENTGKSYDQIFTDADRDCWFTSKEALEYGLIDEIITKKNK